MAALYPPIPTVAEWMHQVQRRRPDGSRSHYEYEVLKARFRRLFPNATPAQYTAAMRAIARATGV